jgi:hypothetical protein
MVGTIHLGVSIHSIVVCRCCAGACLSWFLEEISPGSKAGELNKSMEIAFLTNRLKSYNPQKLLGLNPKKCVLKVGLSIRIRNFSP